jgi:hypothetical protein
LIDECCNTEYPVDLYIYKTESYKLEIFISKWKDRLFLADNDSSFRRSYPEGKFQFNETFRAQVVEPDSRGMKDY